MTNDERMELERKLRRRTVEMSVDTRSEKLILFVLAFVATCYFTVETFVDFERSLLTNHVLIKNAVLLGFSIFSMYVLKELLDVEKKRRDEYYKWQKNLDRDTAVRDYATERVERRNAEIAAQKALSTKSARLRRVKYSRKHRNRESRHGGNLD